MKLNAHTFSDRGAHAPSRASVGALAERNCTKNVFGEAPNTTREGACAPRNEGVALVITLLMLSVITFLAIAFLAMSQRNQSAVSASLDVANARSMADAAQARALSEIMAPMLAHGDPLYYDYMVSRNFVSPSNFYNGEGFDPNNVNYDTFLTNPLVKSTTTWAQNIANLWYDPRPPVFVFTNPANLNSSDFRFWVDINRNGRFETNGYQPTVFDNGLLTGNYEMMNGEPEWIGVLKNPLYPHSVSNQFIGRYAYLVLPIGKTLDLNYIGNFLKANYMNGLGNQDYPASSTGLFDGFARDQGIGSWELNLAGVLDAVSPWAYESNLGNSIGTTFYQYYPPGVKNTGNYGNAFDDAQSILHYRYELPAYQMPSLSQAFPNSSNYNWASFENSYIDIFCATNADGSSYPMQLGSYTTAAQNNSWPGSYQTNQFYDVQDLFDSTKTSIFFTNRMIQASQRTNTFDRYTFQRLLSTIGVGSSPEYGVWVNGDYNGFAYPPPNQQAVMRTKMNLNYDNTAQMHDPKAPYASMPTNLVPWTPLGFFTNAAELLLRSQTFAYTNYILNNSNLLGPPIFAQFGVTNIPIYQSNQPGITYNSSVHRMLQLAANIYDATVSNYYTSLPVTVKNQMIQPPPVRHPSVFRPVFGLTNVGTTNIGIDIIGYVQMTTNAGNSFSNAAVQLQQPFYDLPTAMYRLQNGLSTSNINIWGIPWVVGANKGLPQFYQYSYPMNLLYERKLLFVRYQNSQGLPDTNRPPQYTNQFYCLCVSNIFGMDAWNPYPTPFAGEKGTYCYISNYITVQLTNNYNYGTNLNLTNVYPNGMLGYSPTSYPFWVTNLITWGGWNGNNSAYGFFTPFQTNVAPLPPSYYSEFYKQFVALTNLNITSNAFRTADISQKGWPTHSWTMNITNHIVYALFDGIPGEAATALLDFVNLGPFGNSVNIQSILTQPNITSNPGGLAGMGGGGSSSTLNYWAIGNSTDLATSPMSQGMINQMQTGISINQNFQNDLKGLQPSDGGFFFASSYEPSNIFTQTMEFVANDPMVHYTVGDLILPNQSLPYIVPPFIPLTNDLGKANMLRYLPWSGLGDNMLLKDPQMFSAAAWDFPANKFPGVGWLGRVHRGTPWQTVYLKADNPLANTSGSGLAQLWTNWVASPWVGYPYGPESMPETYPTNDWALVDLFTTSPNDNAARGLLSVNQTNDAAWAGVFAGVIAPNNASNGIPIGPIDDVSNLVDLYSIHGGINSLRTNYPNGIFHKVGDILGAPALTTQQPFLVTNGINPASCSDSVVERIPQQTLSLLKVGEPQFVIFGWGQSLRPKGPPYLDSGTNKGIYTNYEITSEFLTRTVCHLVHTNGLKMVIDSYNVENGSN